MEAPEEGQPVSGERSKNKKMNTKRQQKNQWTASSWEKLKMYLIQKNLLSRICFCYSLCLRKRASKRLIQMSNKIRIAGEVLKDKFDFYPFLSIYFLC